MANREVPLMTDALRLSAISGEISASAAHFVGAKTSDEQKAIAATIQARYQALTATMERLRQGRTNGTFAAVEAASQRLGVNLQALATAIAERSMLRLSLEAKLDAVHKVHAKIGDKLNPIVDDSYFDVVMTAEDVGKTADKIVKSLVNDGLQVMQAIVDVGAETNLVTGADGPRAHVLGPILTLLATVSHPPRAACRSSSPSFRRSRVSGARRRAGKLATALCRRERHGTLQKCSAHESLLGVDLARGRSHFDLVMQSEMRPLPSKVVKELVANQITGLRNARDRARTHPSPA